MKKTADLNYLAWNFITVCKLRSVTVICDSQEQTGEVDL